MKSSLVLALFGVFLMLNKVEAEKCKPMPEIFMKNAEICLAQLSEEDREHFFKKEQLDKRELKCLNLCFLEQLNYFKDGEFNVEEMKKFAREHMPTEELAEAIIARNEDSMMKAMEKGGDNCEIAYEYVMSNVEREQKEPLMSKVFCLPGMEDEGKSQE